MKKKKKKSRHWEKGQEQREQKKLCKKATVELTQSIPQRTSKVQPCCNSVQLRSTRLFSVSKAFPAQESEALIADESRNKGPGRTSCFRGKRKGCPWQTKDTTILQTDWGHSVPLPSSQGPPNLSLVTSSHSQKAKQVCTRAAPQPMETFRQQTPSVRIKHTFSCGSSPETTQAQQCPAEALHHLLLH